MSSGPGATLLASVLLHFLGFTALSMVGGSLWSPSPPSHLITTELLVAPPPPAVPEPLSFPEPEPVPPLPEEPPEAPPGPPPPEPVTPPKVEQITPPKLVEKPMPERVKTPPPVRVQSKTPPPSKPLPRAAAEPAPPGPALPLPAEARTTASGNVLGPPAERPPEAAPPQPVEGGEAGAGKLFDRGEVGVAPGAGAGGGSGGPGRAGLGTGGAGASGGTRVAGLPPGTGDGGGLARPLGGYQVKPRYPEAARRQGIEGVTVLKVRVTERGQVEEVQVERSAGHPALDQSAVEGVRHWRFEPARRGSVPVAVWVLIPVKFELR